jgi:succinate dehydrogenase hydrophobic anchor subunit
MNIEKGPLLEHKRDLMSLSEWRTTQVGMWAWLLQRFSALALIVCITLHLCYPYQVIFQVLLVSAATFHAVLGLRVIVLDLGARVRLQKLLFAGLMGLGVAVLALVLKWRVFY